MLSMVRSVDIWEQMCWCACVCFKVLANLMQRLYIDLLDATYTMGSFWCCSRSRNEFDDDYYKQQELMKGATTEEFYKEVSRDMAEDLLKNKQNGTFIIRSSSKNAHLGTLTLIQDNKIFHLGIRRREDGLVALGNEKNNEKCFSELNSLINYYISNYLVLYSNGERYKTLLLPYWDEMDDL